MKRLSLVLLLSVWINQTEGWSAAVVPPRWTVTGRVQTPRFASTVTDDDAAGLPYVSPMDLTDDEIATLEQIKEDPDGDLQAALLQRLPTLSPRLVVKLQQLSEPHPNPIVNEIASLLHSLLVARLEKGQETLKSLLNAGEIRKLDSLIGQAARDGNLDVAFFKVLSANLEDATANPTPVEKGAASRAQILQHIATRCQEEVEKILYPATALLNKLLRTEQAPIRSNLYKNYLTPQPKTIKSPDGKEVELQGAQPVLVPLDDFVVAVGSAVEQIRTVEQAGGIDRASAAAMVEFCRTVAKEARVVIGEHYGIESEQLKQFEKGLQPVFRPSSPDSPYIKGQS